MGAKEPDKALSGLQARTDRLAGRTGSKSAPPIIHTVVRPKDLVRLRIELHNLAIEPGDPPTLKKKGRGTAHLVLHFPPQAITEETFFERQPPGFEERERNGSPSATAGDPSEILVPPPVRARISGESRLVFVIDDEFDEQPPSFTLEGILEAIEGLNLSVAENARPPVSTDRRVFVLDDMFSADIGNVSVSQRASLSSYAVRTWKIAAVQGDSATVHLRRASGGPGLRPLPAAPAEKVVIDIGPKTEYVFNEPRKVAIPTPPSPLQTAIELPWRLILSPYRAERWRHAKSPVISEATQHTELWHTRLVGPVTDDKIIEFPQPDPRRTVRAVWALTGEGSTKEMQRAFPEEEELPDATTNAPFRMPLEDFDRFQFVHLSSNFSSNTYTPTPVAANLLMLSALGGWLDSRGAWDPPAGLSVEEWVHQATMARDHYVRVVYKGFLFPFGHRVALIKISERKFHQSEPGNTAYLRQRFFLAIRERERQFVDPELKSADGTVHYHRQFPFSSVRILTTVSPLLDPPGSRSIDGNGQNLFWPCVSGKPFYFQCAATDLDGRNVSFQLPMIFMDNTVVNPGSADAPPDYRRAEEFARKTRESWVNSGDLRAAQLQQQRVALAQSAKPGDTSVEVETLRFDAEVSDATAINRELREYSQELSRPVFYPKVDEAQVRIPAVARLTGRAETNTVTWNSDYLQRGFKSNDGQVFVDVVEESGMAMLNFSAQGDRSGGFVQPNLKPVALSRLTGPVTGSVSKFIEGEFEGADAFPGSVSDLPLPLLFGCIPLGEVIAKVTNLAEKPEKIPKFASEANSQFEDLVNTLGRLFNFVAKLADQPSQIAKGAIEATKLTLEDLVDQSQAYTDSLVDTVNDNLSDLTTELNLLNSQLELLAVGTIDSATDLPDLSATESVQTAVTKLRASAEQPQNGTPLPAGFRQSVLRVTNQLDSFVGDVGVFADLIPAGKELFDALDSIVGQPEHLGNLLSDPGALADQLDQVKNASEELRDVIDGSRLLNGAPAVTIRDTLNSVIGVIDPMVGPLRRGDQLLDMLTGDELTVRFDWNPTISNWSLPGTDPETDPLFRANDKNGFLVAVEAKVKKNGQSEPKIGVICSLKHFDLVLVAPKSFIELNFEKVEFSVDSKAKMDVDVVLTDIKFVGALSFVETLRDLIPLDGFSDPPYLDITAQGIDAGFDIALPSVAIGVFNLSNLSLGAGFTVPFIGQPLAVRFNFCTREQPFSLTVCLFGGGGFVGITLDPHGVQILEAALEFGASISIDFGVASGGVHVIAGVYFRLQSDACLLEGYFRLGGNVDVLGLITASLEIYLKLGYEPESGKCVGSAELTIEIEIILFSGSVTITCERKFAGSNGDPSFRDLMGFDPTLSLADELALIDDMTEDDLTEYAWCTYCEAFV